METRFVTQWLGSTGQWSESAEQQNGDDIQTAREFRDRLWKANYDARIVQRTDIVVE